MKLYNLSIGLPCYNEEKNISKVIHNCLNVLKKHKSFNIELIIVDNKSKDRSVSIVQKIIKAGRCPAKGQITCIAVTDHAVGSICHLVN